MDLRKELEAKEKSIDPRRRVIMSVSEINWDEIDGKEYEKEFCVNRPEAKFALKVMKVGDKYSIDNFTGIYETVTEEEINARLAKYGGYYLRKTTRKPVAFLDEYGNPYQV